MKRKLKKKAGKLHYIGQTTRKNNPHYRMRHILSVTHLFIRTSFCPFCDAS